MSDTKNPQYLDLVANAFKTAQAWRFASFTLAAVVVMLTYFVIYQARNTPVVLVPFDLAASTERMKVSVNGELRDTSAEYLSNVALSDITLILNFTPDNVVSQYQRFLNRVTEEVYGNQNAKLLSDADNYKKRGITQTFFPASIKVRAETSQVEINGTQLQWVGGKESVRSTVTYVITYSVTKQFLHVADLHQK